MSAPSCPTQAGTQVPQICGLKRWIPRTREDYHEEAKIGEGTYGSVYLAQAPNGERVALKRIRKEKKEGFPITAIREIRILKTLGALNDKNIVKLKDVVSCNRGDPEGSVYMVFEFCDHDLAGLLEASPQVVNITDAQVKYYMYEILSGLEHCHKNNILHRDIKGANVLVSNSGDVKLADFGLARNEAQGGYTNRVVTLWYRPPELLMGSTNYDNKIDMWSAGCLFAELLSRGKALFRANTELEQLTAICEVCGTPNDENWPDWRKHTNANFSVDFNPPKKRVPFKERFGKHSPEAVDLLDKLLQLDPTKRPSAAEAMNHPYFQKEKPYMLSKDQHPKYKGQFHEYNSQKRKKKRDEEAQKEKKAKEAQKEKDKESSGRQGAIISKPPALVPRSNSAPAKPKEGVAAPSRRVEPSRGPSVPDG